MGKNRFRDNGEYDNTNPRVHHDPLKERVKRLEDQIQELSRAPKDQEMMRLLEENARLKDHNIRLITGVKHMMKQIAEVAVFVGEAKAPARAEPTPAAPEAASPA